MQSCKNVDLYVTSAILQPSDAAHIQLIAELWSVMSCVKGRASLFVGNWGEFKYMLSVSFFPCLACCMEIYHSVACPEGLNQEHLEEHDCFFSICFTWLHPVRYACKLKLQQPSFPPRSRVRCRVWLLCQSKQSPQQMSLKLKLVLFCSTWVVWLRLC